MKKKSLFQMMQEGMEARLRRLCGRIPAHLRLYVVLTMLLFFALLANYVFFNGLYRIFSDGDSEEQTLPAIEHIEAPRSKAALSQRQYQPIKVLRLCSHSKERQPSIRASRLS